MKRWFLRTLSFLLVCAAGCGLFGCGLREPADGSSAEESISEPASGPARAMLSLAEYPRVDGSTACLPLMAAVLAKTCGMSQADAEAKVANISRTDLAWEKLVNQDTDLLLVYEPGEGTRAALETSGVLLEQTAIGRDALVFIKNAQNPTAGLTQEQLRAIYMGKIVNWKEIGGPDTPVIPYQRNADSGSQTLFLKLLMKGIAPMDPPASLVEQGMGSLLEAVAAYENGHGALGFSVYYYAAKMMETPDISILPLDGVTPTDETIADGSYPLVNDFYAVIRADEPRDSPTRKLYDWLRSEDGRDTVQEAGYITASKTQD